MFETFHETFQWSGTLNAARSYGPFQRYHHHHNNTKERQAHYNTGVHMDGDNSSNNDGDHTTGNKNTLTSEQIEEHLQTLKTMQFVISLSNVPANVSRAELRQFIEDLLTDNTQTKYLGLQFKVQRHNPTHAQRKAKTLQQTAMKILMNSKLEEQQVSDFLKDVVAKRDKYVPKGGNDSNEDDDK